MVNKKYLLLAGSNAPAFEETKSNGSKAKSFASRVIRCEEENFFGETIREVRNQKKITQVDAAERLGITQALLSSYELGKTRPTLDVVLQMSKMLSIDPFDLLEKALTKSEYFKENFTNKEVTKQSELITD